MKGKILAILLVYIYIYTIATAPAVWALSDATSFSPEKVQVQAQSIGVPVGTVIVWTKNTIPDGWLECNGQKVNKTLYPDLAALMSNVPNYQGMFLRGAGSQWKNYNGYGWTEHGTTLGHVQGDSIRNITGDFIPVDGGEQGTSGAFHTEPYQRHHIYASAPMWNSQIYKFNASRVVPTANENRPVNVGVKYIIKAE